MCEVFLDCRLEGGVPVPAAGCGALLGHEGGVPVPAAGGGELLGYGRAT